MAKKAFKTQSKRILELMINSIYTNKEIFLRELISNASDAIDKLYYTRLRAGDGGVTRDDYAITLSFDKDARTLTVADNGIGMTAKELEENLGTIAQSGSLQFKSEADEDTDIIGQFGVGFYSSFMVAKRVEVYSLAEGSSEGSRWVSDGADGYSISPADIKEVGSRVVLTLRDDCEEENYSRFLDQYALSELVKKYSDYIRYPIKMEMSHSHKKPDSDEYETHTELETLNSMVPIWKKNKSELDDAECAEFYKSKFFDYEDPLCVIHQKTEGAATFSGIMFVPARAPYNYYTKEYEKGLQLYSSGVLITEHCSELLPDFLGFVKGVIDSEDLSLNISREMLQQDRQLKVMATAIEKRLLKEFAELLESDRDKYEKLFEAFGLQFKYGVYADFGMNKDKLKDLLMFRSANTDKLVTLSEYVKNMPESQKYIYYAAGDKTRDLKHLPAAERVLDSGYDLLLMTDEVDEFAVTILHEYEGKEFRSVASGDLGLMNDEEKKTSDEEQKEHKELLDELKKLLEGKVADVRISTRLKTYPVCLASEGAVSIEMEKVINALPASQKVTATRILELNDEHPVFEKLTKADGETLAMYARMLYNQALLIEGLPVDDPAQFSLDVCKLM